MNTREGVTAATSFLQPVLLLQGVPQDSRPGVTLILPIGSSHLWFLGVSGTHELLTLGVIRACLPQQNVSSPKVGLGIFHCRIPGTQPGWHRTAESLGSGGRSGWTGGQDPGQLSRPKPPEVSKEGVVITLTDLETERRRRVLTKTMRLAILSGLGPSVRIGKLCYNVSPLLSGLPQPGFTHPSCKAFCGPDEPPGQLSFMKTHSKPLGAWGSAFTT